MHMPFGENETCAEAENFKARLNISIEQLIHQGYLHMISGGAMGMDLMAAETVLSLKKRYPSLCLELAVPWAGQA